MNLQSFFEYVARRRQRILNVLLNVMGRHDVAPAGWGLPAGGVHLTNRRVILAGTPCSALLFEPAMRRAAAATGADVVLAHFSLDPDARRPARFSVLTRLDDRPYLLEDMVLYADQSGRHWLLPSNKGPFVAMLRDGLRVDVEPPFLTRARREAGTATYSPDDPCSRVASVWVWQVRPAARERRRSRSCRGGMGPVAECA